MSARAAVADRLWWSMPSKDDEEAHALAAQLLDAYRDEVLENAAPPCAVCETAIEWVACPTGGWWAHHVHPDDNHDARPPI